MSELAFLEESVAKLEDVITRRLARMENVLEARLDKIEDMLAEIIEAMKR